MDIFNTDIHFFYFEILLSKFTDKKFITDLHTKETNEHNRLCYFPGILETV